MYARVVFSARHCYWSIYLPFCLSGHTFYQNDLLSTAIFLHLDSPLSIISRCFFGLVTVCKNQKLQHVGLYFNVEQHHLLRSTLGPGVAFPVQVMRKKYDLMKEEAFLKPSLKCRRVFMSAAVIVNITEPHGDVIMVPKSAPLGAWMRV